MSTYQCWPTSTPSGRGPRSSTWTPQRPWPRSPWSRATTRRCCGAVEWGLALAPSREALYQAWMHALGRSGDAQRLKDVYGRCWSMLRSEIHATQAPSAETELIWRSYLQRWARPPSPPGLGHRAGATAPRRVQARDAHRKAVPTWGLRARCRRPAASQHQALSRVFGIGTPARPQRCGRAFIGAVVTSVSRRPLAQDSATVLAFWPRRRLRH